MAEHAEIGGSAVDRILACAGSVRESRGKPDRVTRYAIEGTAAHDVAAQCLNGQRSPDDFLDRYITVVEGNGESQTKHLVHVEEEMVESVRTYLLESHKANDFGFSVGNLSGAETKVSINELIPQYLKPLFGWVDRWVLRVTQKRLVVIDFKYGKGIVVDAIDNGQLRYYALGLLCMLKDYPIDDVELIIVQPRGMSIDLPPIRREILAVPELLEWLDTILAPGIMKTEEPNAPLVAGPHCIFCRAAGECETLRRDAFDRAMVKYHPQDVMPLEEEVLQDPSTLTPMQVSQLLEFTDRILLWARAFREHAFSLINVGIEVPDWKIVAREGRRRWTKPPEAIAAELAFRWSLPVEHLWNNKLKSPAQIEEVIRKQRRGKSTKLIISGIKDTGLWEKPITGTTLARADDPRLAVLGADVVGFEKLE